ncbi:hypothetical protein BHE74_00005601 [Ensete ventricosum]|nr:hypothetical protein BHE74_00005601 [Ensete ventricosum]RZR97903.1 hypothetical protein BHM03_00027165 [Ensete ventricosum]
MNHRIAPPRVMLGELRRSVNDVFHKGRYVFNNAREVRASVLDRSLTHKKVCRCFPQVYHRAYDERVKVQKSTHSVNDHRTSLSGGAASALAPGHFLTNCLSRSRSKGFFSTHALLQHVGYSTYFSGVVGTIMPFSEFANDKLQ